MAESFDLNNQRNQRKDMNAIPKHGDRIKMVGGKVWCLCETCIFLRNKVAEEKWK